MNTMPITVLDGLGCAGMQQPCQCSAAVGMRGLGEAAPIIHWNTEPNTSADGRKVSWTCNDWIEWHKKIAVKYGVARANEVTQQWWDRLPWTDSKLYTCPFNCTFHNYFKKVGGGKGSFVPTLVCKTDEVFADITDSAGNVIVTAAQAAENVANAAKNTAKVASWIVPTLIVAAVTGVGYYAYKHYIKGNSRVKVGPGTV